MHMKLISAQSVFVVALVMALCGCKKSIKEPPIMGHPSDPPVTMRPVWKVGQRYIYRVDAVNSTQVPRRNTSRIIRADVTVGQDLGLTVTNELADGSRIIQLELLSIQMETAADDRVTTAFDSENRTLVYEDNNLAERLEKLVGASLAFHVSPENRIKKIEGAKEFSARMAGGSVRGVAGGVFGRFFSVAFFREVIEMGMLPAGPVNMGDKWTVSRPVNGGVWAANALLELNYEFRGWQMHDGTNCARVDFSGVFKPNTPSRTTTSTNQSLVRRIVTAATSPNSQDGTVTGRSWFEPGIALPVETIYEQVVTTKSVTVKRPPRRMNITTNTTTAVQPDAGTNTPPEIVTTTIKARQQTTITLFAIDPVAAIP
jgi:hypothetical protein